MHSAHTPPAIAPSGERNRFAAAYGVLNEAIRARAFPGCAFGVLAQDRSGNRIELLDALGHFTYEEDARAVTPETVYDVASVTKVVATTAAAMLLHQRGRLDLETPLGALLPGFLANRANGTGPAEDKIRRAAGAVTLRHLLAHNSGLPGYVEFFRTARTPEALLDACMDLPLEAQPGTRVAYSDPGFILLGKALEALTGEPLASWAQREIFQPLGLSATCFSPTPAAGPLIPPTEHDRTVRHRVIQGEVQDENAWLLGGAAGHAGLFSNVRDLLRFADEILLAASETGTARLFSAETIATFAERQGPAGSSRALGWDTPSENSSSGIHFSQHSIGHLGYSGSSLWIDLEAAVAVVLLTNRTWPDRRNQQIRTLRPVFHDAIRAAL